MWGLKEGVWGICLVLFCGIRPPLDALVAGVRAIFQAGSRLAGGAVSIGGGCRSVSLGCSLVVLSVANDVMQRVSIGGYE